MADDPNTQASARADLQSTLDEFGLGSLTDWGYNEVAAGKTSQEILQDLRQTDAYKTRFQANVIREKQGLAPLPESQIISYEQNASSIARQYGLPAELYSDPSHWQEAIANDVGLPELQARIQDGYAKVTANPAIRAQFNQWYGTDGDTALAMYFMDNERALPLLERQVTAGTLGSLGQKFGVPLTQDRAEALAAQGINADTAGSQFAQVDRIKPLFDETVSEYKDLTAQDQGLDAAFNLGGTGAFDIQRRLDERTAAMAGGGGARVTQDASALGSAPA